MSVCIITISFPLATFCAPYHDPSSFCAVATIDIFMFTSSSGGEEPRNLQTLHTWVLYATLFAINLLLWIPLLFPVSAHRTFTKSLRKLDFAISYGAPLEHEHFVEVLHFQLPGLAHFMREQLSAIHVIPERVVFFLLLTCLVMLSLMVVSSAWFLSRLSHGHPSAGHRVAKFVTCCHLPYLCQFYWSVVQIAPLDDDAELGSFLMPW